MKLLFPMIMLTTKEEINNIKDLTEEELLNRFKPITEKFIDMATDVHRYVDKIHDYKINIIEKDIEPIEGLSFNADKYLEDFMEYSDERLCIAPKDDMEPAYVQLKDKYLSILNDFKDIIDNSTTYNILKDEVKKYNKYLREYELAVDQECTEMIPIVNIVVVDKNLIDIFRTISDPELYLFSDISGEIARSLISKVFLDDLFDECKYPESMVNMISIIPISLLNDLDAEELISSVATIDEMMTGDDLKDAITSKARSIIDEMISACEEYLEKCEAEESNEEMPKYLS